ncbi:MAG TPA: cell division protein FtsZ, partial [Rhodospirillales bacterium]|nr:cell division protein FtsZ [Rhodospirillales bacterium]
MVIEIGMPDSNVNTPGSARIGVIGVGGAGGNAINNMIAADMDGVDFMAGNTDAQALGNCQAGNTLQLGPHVTSGLGCGANVDCGRAAAEESIDDIHRALSGYNLVFVAAGMGGGTGTGAAPVIARAAREQQALTIGVVTTPFDFEGDRRMRTALAGLKTLEENVDCLVVIPNQNLFRVIDSKTTFAEAFNRADGVLYHAIRSVTDLIVLPGLINLDFADVKTVMQCRGRAMMGVGEAAGPDRAIQAAEA